MKIMKLLILIFCFLAFSELCFSEQADTVIFKDGAIISIEWQLDSISASTDNFLIEEIKYSFDNIYIC